MSELLQVDIKKSYPEFYLEAKLHVNQGEFFSLVGPSGCGKTTLLRIIAGLEEPDGGSIILAGKDITGLSPAKRKIGLVFQDYALFPHMSVAGNIEYGLKVAQIPVADRKRKLNELLDLLELEGMADRGVNQLSGGERQRVALARSLAPGPLLLLLDEPFSALDYGLRYRLRRDLKDLQKKLGFTVIFVTHQQEEALSLSERLAVMQAGKVIQTGTARDIYEYPAHPFVAGFLGDANLLPCRAETDHTRANDGRTRIFLETGDSFILPPSVLLDDGEYILMIRPEDIDINPSYSPVLLAEVVRIEYLGFLSRLEIRWGERLIKVYAPKELRIEEGARINIGFHPLKVRLLPA